MNAGDGLRTDILVIGAGQAGLATAHSLAGAGLQFLIVDSAVAVGDSWRKRYESLTLFTPRSISALPGMPLVGDPDGYATKDEFADYLARYANRNSVQVIGSTRIVRLVKVGRFFEAFTDAGRVVTCQSVIVATGSFSSPRIPVLPGRLPSTVKQMHVADFQDTGDVPAGTVLVVGDGASGRDMAVTLTGSHRVLMSGGRKRKLLPERILGRSIWWWLKTFGLLRASPNSLIGRRMRREDPFPGRGNDDAALIRKGVMLKDRLVELDDDNAIFQDGSREPIRSVIWATGYVDDFGWIEIDGATDGKGASVHREGISSIDGLYFVGRPWQRNRASGLIAGVGEDAIFVVNAIRRRGGK
ncbi:flavin-containing monooxygenase [Neorhizobium sp. LjRoot104]|uniref:flavin-containing monooxygenase n=1 Tax=Neorhizobium sp. LjRoot104 TaxID=3342254 RepID=UPI003ECD9D68